MNASGQGNWMDKLFHKKLSDFEVSPQDHVWESIARKLDESQRRPVLFGNWWTILLSLILLLLVTGAGAFMLYKRYSQHKLEKNQNKDLPYLRPGNDHNDNSSLISSAELNTITTTPSKDIITNNSVAAKSTIPSKKNNVQSNDKVQVSDSEENKPDELEIPLTVDNSTPAKSGNSTNQFNSNELIASTDKNFITGIDTEQKLFSYSYLPIKESFLKKDNDSYHSPKLVDGCNVYRNTNTHFFVDVYYAPELANRTLKTNDPSLSSYVKERINSEKPILSYSLGLKASMILSNGFSIRGGISYSNNTERFDFVKLTKNITTDIYDDQHHWVRTEVTRVVIMDKVYNSYKFLDIPILLGYEKELKDFVLALNGGIGLNILSSQSGKIYKDTNDPHEFYALEDNGEANKPIFRSNAGVSVIGSVGLNYKYNERIMLLFEPSARYYLRSLSDPSNPVSQNYLFLGMNIGMRYRIK